MLFQAGGCTVGGQDVTAIFLANTLQNLVATVVFSSFNLIP